MWSILTLCAVHRASYLARPISEEKVLVQDPLRECGIHKSSIRFERGIGTHTFTR